MVETDHYPKFGSHLPAELSKQIEALKARLG
jgi:GTP-dependent phosphoenolpyruvate carboxykinase